MDSLHLNWVDYIILLLITFTMLSGFNRGLFREILSLLTLVAAYVVASIFSNTLAASLIRTDSVQHAMNQMATSANAEPVSMLAVGVSFSLLFLGTVILGSIISYIINYAFSKGVLGIGNRFLGALFGICKGAAIALAVVFVVQLTSVGEAKFWHESQIITEMQPTIQLIGKQVSPSLDNLKERFEKTMQEIQPKA